MGRVLRCLVAWCLVVLGSAVSAGVRVENLTCEYLENPMGLDVAKPRLSWMLQSNERGQKQTAYQLLIADREELLKNEQGNLWDTGKVASDQCVHVVYAGKPLASRTRCFWKVRVWDAEGKVSPWSQPATWEMGLLEASDWKAQWIGRDEPPAPKSVQLAGSSWIWYPEGKAEEAAPIGTRYFRRTVSLPEGREIRKATLYATGDNRAILFVNGK